jgi:hypothetical protein
MNDFKKLNTIKSLKRFMINHQQWVICAYLRDLERTKFKDIIVSDESYKVKDFDISQYLFSKELIQSYSVEWSKDVDDIHKILDKELTHLIRYIKISSLNI